MTREHKTCEFCRERYTRKKGKSHNDFLKRKYCSTTCRTKGVNADPLHKEKISRGVSKYWTDNPEKKEEMSNKLKKHYKENKHNSYKNGRRSDMYSRYRKRVLRQGLGAHGLWKQAVLIIDCDSCRLCESKDELHVDHIKPFSTHPELKFAIDNGRTLCANCHRKTDTYGVRL